MRLVYLIRHASPAVQPQAPAEEWRLSERGIDEARALAAIAAGWGLRAVYSSTEPKALSTAALIGDATGLTAHAVEGFEELRLSGGWIGNADAFSDTVRAVLETPELSLRGSETAEAAAARFAAGMAIVETGQFPAAVVSHGRAIVAYLAQYAGADEPFALWRSIATPGWIVLDLDGMRLLGSFEGLPA
jgi:broad specificity phosphatase PhoE